MTTTPAFPAVVFSVTDAGIAELDKCIDEIPGVSTEIGKHYAADLRECLESLLLSWSVEAKEAA